MSIIQVLVDSYRNSEITITEFDIDGTSEPNSSIIEIQVEHPNLTTEEFIDKLYSAGI